MTEHPATQLAALHSALAAHGHGELSAAALGDTARAQQALLANWLHGCLSAPTLEDALSARDRLAPGETVFVASGHAVTAHSVSFYAPDSEQAGLLSREQDN